MTPALRKSFDFNQLLLSIVKPYKSLGLTTIPGWIKKGIGRNWL